MIVEDDDIIVIPPLSVKEKSGRILKGLRLSEGLTQKQVADAIGVPVRLVSEYEQFKRPIPENKAQPLAALLNSVPGNFIFENQQG